MFDDFTSIDRRRKGFSKIGICEGIERCIKAAKKRGRDRAHVEHILLFEMFEVGEGDLGKGGADDIDVSVAGRDPAE